MAGVSMSSSTRSAVTASPTRCGPWRPWGGCSSSASRPGRSPRSRSTGSLLNNVSVVGVGWGAYWMSRPDFLARQWEDLLPLLNAGALTPVIGQTFTLEQTAEAIALRGASGHRQGARPPRTQTVEWENTRCQRHGIPHVLLTRLSETRVGVMTTVREFRNLHTHGFARVAACTVPVAMADRQPTRRGSRSRCRPSMTTASTSPSSQSSRSPATPSTTCSSRDVLLDAVDAAVIDLARTTAKLRPVVVVGAPSSGARLYNCAVVLHRGGPRRRPQGQPAELPRVLREALVRQR